MEAAVGIAGLALAIPGVIDVLIRGGDYIVKKIDTYQTVNATLNDYRQLGLDLSQGVFNEALRQLKGSCRDRLVPDSVVIRLNEALQKATKAQEAATAELNKVKPDTAGKARFALWGERHLKSKYLTFKQAMDEIERLCTTIHQIQTGPSSSFLRPECFKVKHEMVGTPSGKALAMSDILEVDGNYSLASQRREGKFILERKTREEDIKFLSGLLDKATLPVGLPKCLGYRQPPYNDPGHQPIPIFELVFVAPLVAHQSLAALLTNEPSPAFDRRIEVAKLVVEAVQNAHGLDVVHKAVRSRVILVENWNAPSATSGSAQALNLYLHDWTCVREVSAATSMLGGDLSWPRSIYQHPDRQGSPGHYPEVEYEVKHDLYSLGVVMLEIFLWTPFINETLSDSGLPELQISAIFEQRGLRLGEVNGGLPSRYAGNSSKLASRPNATKTVWKSLATEDLAPINQKASDIVCKCLDDSFSSATEVLQALKLI